jgi:hypothetical protein
MVQTMSKKPILEGEWRASGIQCSIFVECRNKKGNRIKRAYIDCIGEMIIYYETSSGYIVSLRSDMWGHQTKRFYTAWNEELGIPVGKIF